MDTKVAKITRSWTSPVISSPTTSLFLGADLLQALGVTSS